MPTGGIDELEPPIGVEPQRPTPLVDGVMMPVAQWNQIAEIGGTSPFPFVNVVKLAPRNGPLACIPSTGSIQGPYGLPLSVGCRPVLAPDIDGDSVLIPDDPLKHGIAGQSGN